MVKLSYLQKLGETRLKSSSPSVTFFNRLTEAQDAVRVGKHRLFPVK